MAFDCNNCLFQGGCGWGWGWCVILIQITNLGCKMLKIKSYDANFDYTINSRFTCTKKKKAQNFYCSSTTD